MIEAFRRWSLGGAACALFLHASGCAEPPRRASFPVLVHVESDPRSPLEGAVLRAAGGVAGTSDRAGKIALTLRGEPGDVVALQLACPDGYREPAAPLSVLLRPHERSESDPEFRLSCRPLLRKLVIAVRASAGPDLPLFYLGQEIARTNASGVAHAVLKARPGDVLSLTLDTSGEPGLMPQHPELKLNVPDRDELVVFDQRFARPKPKVRPRPKPPEPEVPERI
jgi:hypothetical protein